MADGDLIYPIKEVLEEIRASQREILQKLDRKAERDAVENIDRRLVLVEAQDKARQGLRIDEATSFAQVRKDVDELQRAAIAVDKVQLRRDVDHLTREVSSAQAAAKAIDTYRKWLIGVMVSVGGLIISVLWIVLSKIH